MFTAFLVYLFYLQNLACVSAAQVYPVAVEVDVVFPRNDTYAPIPLMPIVFALQNPQPSLIIGIEVSLVRFEDEESALLTQTLDLTETNFSSNPYFAANATMEPYFVVDITTHLNQEGTFILIWELMTGNCSVTETKPGLDICYNNPTRTVFTIKNSAQQPSLVTSPDNCPAHSRTFNVTGTVEIDPGHYNGHNTCATLGEPPAPNPCAVKVDSALASKISASISATACGWEAWTETAVNASSACPTTTAAKSGASVRWDAERKGLNRIFLEP